MFADERPKEEERCEWAVRDRKEKREEKKTDVHNLIYTALHNRFSPTPSLPCLRVRHWRIKGSSILLCITTSTKSPSIQHTQDRVPLMPPLREVERILQHSRAVTQEATFCLKVSSCLLSVPHEMAGDSSLRHGRNDSTDYIHRVPETLVCTPT